MASSRHVAPESDRGLRRSLQEKDRHRRKALSDLSKAAHASYAARNDIRPTLRLEDIGLDAIHLPQRKLRKADAAHVREVANSISAYGFCDPVLVGNNNRLLNGAIRIEAARSLGLASVPCVRIDHLSEAEQRMLTLAANRLQEKGSWDLDALKFEFDELIVLDQPVEISGFSPQEIDSILLAENAVVTEVGPLEPLPGAVAIVRPGDVFELGSHRIVCGDARDPDVLSLLMEDTPEARLVFTDEPYNVQIKGHVSGGNHREFAMASGELSHAQFLEFNIEWMRVAIAHLCDGGLLATFIDWRGFSKVQSAAESLDLDLLNLIVWTKTNAGMGSLYRSQHELLPLFKKGSVRHVNNVELGRKGRWRSNVWPYPGASSIGSDARRGLKDHPTVKPAAMLEDALLDLTHRGDVVLDPFLGSGSTLIACEKTGRACRGVEIDPLFVEVVLRRFEAMTGKAPVLAEPNVGS